MIGIAARTSARRRNCSPSPRVLAVTSATLYSDRHDPVDPINRWPMNARDEQRVATARQRLVDLLVADEGILPGGLVERMTRCGKQNCRCSGEPPQLHGPYVCLLYTSPSPRDRTRS